MSHFVKIVHPLLLQLSGIVCTLTFGLDENTILAGVPVPTVGVQVQELTRI